MPSKPEKGFKPDYAIPPGETIKELLETRRISVWTLAHHLQLSVGEVLDLCEGNLKISQTLATDLEKVFNVPAYFWLNLQAQYDEAKGREKK